MFSACAANQKQAILLDDFPERAIFLKAVNDIGQANDIDTSKISLFYSSGAPYSIILTADNQILVGPSFVQKYWVNGNPDYVYCFVAHELAHYKLGHIGKRQAASYLTTALMLGLNMIVPGAGLINLAVNPLVTSGFSRSQELDADQEAVRMWGTKEKYVKALQWIYEGINQQTGIMATHPPLDERIDNLKRAVQ